ncbi:MAG: hypothetical protein PGN13_05310 [Patulibacter minatonensis]
MSRIRPALLSLSLAALLAAPAAAHADTYTVDGYTSCANTSGYTGSGGTGFAYQLLVTTNGELAPGRANQATAQLRFKRSFTGGSSVVTWPDEAFTATLPFADGTPTLAASAGRQTPGEWGSSAVIPITITVPADGTPPIAAAPRASYARSAGETRSPVDGMVVVLPEGRYGDCLSNESVTLPTAAPAGTVKLTEAAGCPTANGGGSTLTYELTVTSPALRGTSSPGTAQLRYLSRPTDVRKGLALDPGETVEPATLTVGSRTFSLPAMATGKLTQPAQPARWVNGPPVPITISSSLGDSTVSASLGELRWSIGGGTAIDRVDGMSILYQGYGKTCFPTSAATISTQPDLGFPTETPTATATPTATPTPTASPETPTPTPTVVPRPTVTLTAGAVGVWSGGAKGASASAPATLVFPGGNALGATLSVAPLSANLKALGFLPVAVKATLSQVGQAAGTRTPTELDLTIPSKLAVSSAKFVGIELVTTRTCQSRASFPMRYIATGSRLTTINGTGQIPPLMTCGASTVLTSSALSGRFALSLLGLEQA